MMESKYSLVDFGLTCSKLVCLRVIHDVNILHDHHDILTSHFELLPFIIKPNMLHLLLRLVIYCQDSAL